MSCLSLRAVPLSRRRASMRVVSRGRGMPAIIASAAVLVAAGCLAAAEPAPAPAPDTVAARVAAQQSKPSVHLDPGAIADALAIAGVPEATVARLFDATLRANLPGMAARIDAFLFFTRDPEWLAMRRHFAEFLELPEVQSLDAADAAALRGYGGVVSLPAINHLSPQTARAFESFGTDYWGAAVELPGVVELEPEAASALARCKALLVLPHLERLSAESARQLARHEGIGIVIGGLDRLPADVAAALAEAKSIQGLLLPDLVVLESQPLARRLARQDHAFLPAITMLDPAVAEALRGNEGGELALPGIEMLSPDVARHLVGAGYYWLTFGCAATLTAETAEILARHNGQLTFTGPAVFSAAAAAALANHKGTLILAHVGELPADVPQALSPHAGALVLGGVTRLTPEAARALSTHAGRLVLPAVESLDAPVAAALAEHAGGLVLPGVCELSTATAAALALVRGPVWLPALERISPRGLELLSAKPGTQLPEVESLDVVPGL